MTDRLAWPMAVGPDGRLATVQQDSDEDINQCLRAIRRTRLGDRPDLPTMGVPDLEFSEQPGETESISDVLARHEPRASILLTSEPDAADPMLVLETDGWARQQPDEQET